MPRLFTQLKSLFLLVFFFIFTACGGGSNHPETTNGSTFSKIREQALQQVSSSSQPTPPRISSVRKSIAVAPTANFKSRAEELPVASGTAVPTTPSTPRVFNSNTLLTLGENPPINIESSRENLPTVPSVPTLPSVSKPTVLTDFALPPQPQLVVPEGSSFVPVPVSPRAFPASAPIAVPSAPASPSIPVTPTVTSIAPPQTSGVVVPPPVPTISEKEAPPVAAAAPTQSSPAVVPAEDPNRNEVGPAAVSATVPSEEKPGAQTAGFSVAVTGSDGILGSAPDIVQTYEETLVSLSLHIPGSPDQHQGLLFLLAQKESKSFVGELELKKFSEDETRLEDCGADCEGEDWVLRVLQCGIIPESRLKEQFGEPRQDLSAAIGNFYNQLWQGKVGVEICNQMQYRDFQVRADAKMKINFANFPLAVDGMYMAYVLPLEPVDRERMGPSALNETVSLQNNRELWDKNFKSSSQKQRIRVLTAIESTSGLEIGQ